METSPACTIEGAPPCGQTPVDMTVPVASTTAQTLVPVSLPAYLPETGPGTPDVLAGLGLLVAAAGALALAVVRRA